MKRVKKIAAQGAKAAIKKKRTAKRVRTPLYTDKEREERKKLLDQKSYYKKQIRKETKKIGDNKWIISLKEVRSEINDDLAYELKRRGYFDKDKEDLYNGNANKDFREWMREENDSDLMLEVIEDYNSIMNEDTKIRTDVDDESLDAREKIGEYANRIREVDRKLAEMKLKAEDRKHMKIAKDVARKNKLKNQESLADAIDKGHISMSKLSRPERMAVEYIKDKFATKVADSINLDNIEESKRNIIRHGIYNAASLNPMEGVRSAIKESITESVTAKYGNSAAGVAESLINIATGKGSMKSVGMSIFNGVVSKSGLNPALMNERAEELIGADQSTFEKENMKRLGRDVVVDIAKDIIKSGGNIYAAIPMAIKDVLFDVGKAGVRQIGKPEKKAKTFTETSKPLNEDDRQDVENKFFD